MGRNRLGLFSLGYDCDNVRVRMLAQVAVIGQFDCVALAQVAHEIGVGIHLEGDSGSLARKRERLVVEINERARELERGFHMLDDGHLICEFVVTVFVERHQHDVVQVYRIQIVELVGCFFARREFHFAFFACD